jgi:hypothetical protein
MAVTFAQMAEEVSRKMAGFTYRQDRQTHLITTITSTSLSITVQSAINISSGIIQIDDELIYIDSYDRNTGILSVPPYGRGYNGTTAIAHTAGAKIVISPTYPIVDVKESLNEVIAGSFPALYQVKSTTFTYSPAKSTYALPVDAINILQVSYQSVGPSKEWVPIRAYRIDNMANSTAFSGTTNTISLYSGITPGRTVQVWYATEPDLLVNPTDDFATITGLPQSCKDVVVYGACYKLSSFIDAGRLSYSSAESDAQSASTLSIRSFAAGANASKYLYQIYNQRLIEESQKLDDLYPVRIHYTR